MGNIKINSNLLEEIAGLKSVDEVIELAKLNGIDLSQEKAEKLYNQAKTGVNELEDDDLDLIAGGCGIFNDNSDIKLCPKCGADNLHGVYRISLSEYPDKKFYCSNCKYYY